MVKTCAVLVGQVNMYPCRKTRKDQTTQVTPWPVACGRRRQRHFPHSSTPLAQLSKLLAHLRRCELFVHIQIATPEPLKRLLRPVYAMSFEPFFDIQLLWEPFFQNSPSSVKTLGASNFAKTPLGCFLQIYCELFCLMIHLHQSHAHLST